MKRVDEDRLTKKERIFAEELIKNGYDCTNAWRVASPTCDGTTANAYAWKVFNRPRVKKYVDELEKQALDRAGIRVERVMRELGEIAFSKDKYTTNERLKALDLLSKNMGIQVNKIEAKVEETVIEVKIEDDEEGE